MLAMVESDQDFLDFSRAMRSDGSIYSIAAKATACPFSPSRRQRREQQMYSHCQRRVCAGGVQIFFSAAKLPGCQVAGAD
jgi:hypothetical protein